LRARETRQRQQARCHGKTDHELSFHSFSLFGGRRYIRRVYVSPLPIYRRCAHFMTCEGG
jgi:hypothetical protein